MSTSRNLCSPDNVTIQYQPINCCSTLYYAKRDLTPWHYVFSPRSTGNSYRSSHILGRLTKHYLSLFLIDRSIFTSSTCHLPFHTSVPESASGEQAVWSATESPIAFLGKTKIPNFAKHHRLTRRCLSASNKVDGDHDDQDEQDEGGYD